MTVRTIAEIKALFETGDVPDGDDFEDFIDTLFYGSVSTVAASGAAQTLDADPIAHIVTLTDDCTITFPSPDFDYHIFELILIQDGVGGWDVTWPGTVEWSNGSPPVLVTTASNKSILIFTSYDQGVSWFGTVIGESVG